MQRNKQMLVLNETPKLLENQFQQITLNLAPNWRYDILEGRQHMVVPMVMLTEGVHAGSAGPLFYGGDEISRAAESWNHMPIVVYHPEENGVGVSARKSDVINARKIGIVLNSHMEGTKQHAEAWLERTRVQKVDSRILEKLDARESVELSTGLYTDNNCVEGEWNGEKFGGSVSNFRPDHLAILPDQKGACSIADGAGLLQNNQGVIVDKKKFVEDLITNSSWDESDKEFLMSLNETQLKKMEIKKEIKKNKADDPPKKKEEKKVEPKDEGAKIIKMPLAQNVEEEKPQTVADYINNAPSEIKDMLGSALRAHNSLKINLVEAIMANTNNIFTKEMLENKELTELEAIAKLAQVKTNHGAPVPTYAGLEGAFTANAGPVDQMAVEPLGLPELKF